MKISNKQKNAIKELCKQMRDTTTLGGDWETFAISRKNSTKLFSTSLKPTR